MDALGLSSYPNLTTVAGSAKLIGLFQLTYADLDVGAYGQAQMGPFATMGLATTSLAGKPALEEGDNAFARRVVGR